MKLKMVVKAYVAAPGSWIESYTNTREIEKPNNSILSTYVDLVFHWHKEMSML